MAAISDLQAACDAVAPGLQSQRERGGGSECQFAEVLDVLYDVRRKESLSKPFVEQLNATQRRIDRWVEEQRVAAHAGVGVRRVS